ncbi:hypothetical protein GLYMA_20G011850v4 [Glycine max]|nr:hypothetical protein GLYMA_20G011850v4 [Glycine max]KAH1034025.1 hypothetical protein GYH30_054433 [Glycine max]
MTYILFFFFFLIFLAEIRLLVIQLQVSDKALSLVMNLGFKDRDAGKGIKNEHICKTRKLQLIFCQGKDKGSGKKRKTLKYKMKFGG